MPRSRELTKPASKSSLTRDRHKVIVVYAVTLVCVYLCYRLAQPFIPALVFAITVAVVTQPLMRWLERRIASPSLRAAIGVAIVTVAILAPLGTTIYLLAQQIAHAVQAWQQYLNSWQQLVDREAWLASAWNRLSQNLDITAAIERFAAAVNTAAMAVATGSIHSLFQALIMLYVLFFLYRDRDRFLKVIKRLSPLSTRETNRLLKRLGDTVHSTVFGVVAVAVIQGALGGVIFGLLGIPGAVLWASVMALLALIPNLGTFVIWGPASLLLLTDGHWGKALILVLWGLTAIALIDNLLYPFLVGNRMRTHTLIVFLAILGGIAVFGPTGVILGPVVVNLTIFLLELWRRRTERAPGQEKPLTA